MKLQMDAFANMDTPLHNFEPRSKLIAFMVLIFAFSFIADLRLLPGMAVVAVVLYSWSQLPLSFFLKRLRLPGFFLVIMAVLLPLLSGETVLFHLGPLSIKQEGCMDLLLISVKFLSIYTLGMILFGTTPFLTVVKAMRALGLPLLMSDMILFTYRYLFEIESQLKSMQTALKLRGFSGRSYMKLGVSASLVGTLLVRNYEHAEQAYKAMILRGYGSASFQRTANHLMEKRRFERGTANEVLPRLLLGKRDVIIFLSMIFIAAGLITAEVYF